MSKKKRNKNHVNRMIKASVLTTQVLNLANPYISAAFASESVSNNATENVSVSDGFVQEASSSSVVSSVYMKAQIDEPPYYTWLSPQASGVSFYENLFMAFSEEVQLGAGHLVVHRQDGSEVGRINVSGGTVTGGDIRFSGQSVVMKLDHLLTDSTDYYVEVSSGMFVDRAGQGNNAIWDKNTWSFRTADATAPKLVRKVSPEGSELSGSSPVAGFMMEFNEPMKWGQGYVRLHEALGGTVVRELRITGAGNSNFMLKGEENIAYIELSGELEEGKSYYLEITSGALTDLAMNPYVGMHTPEDWTFRVRDERPYSIYTYPREYAHTLTPDLGIAFSEEMQLGTGRLVMHRQDGSEVGRINVSGGTVTGGDIRFSGQSVVMKLDHPLTDSTDYYVEVSSGMFVDRAGQGNNAIWDKNTWSFRTADVTAPKLVRKVSPEGSELSGSGPVAGFMMEFNEPMKWGQGYVRLHEALGGTVVRELRITGAGNSNFMLKGEENIAYIELSGELEEGKSYYLEITSGALTDLAMNPYVGMHTPEDWTFRVRDERPYSIYTYPREYAHTLTPDLGIAFSEEMQLGTGRLVMHRQDGSEVGRINVSGGTVTGGDIRFSGQSVVMKLDHLLTDSTDYYVEVSSGMFVDRAGQGNNAIWDKNTWSFRTADVTAPKLVRKVSPEGSELSGSSPVAGFMMEFNEPMKWGQGYVRLHEALGGTVVRELRITGAGNSNFMLKGEENIAYIELSGELEEGKSYYLEITSGALTDLAMNPYVGMHTPEDWTFRVRDERPRRSKDKETSDQDTSSAASPTENKTGVVIADAKTASDKSSTIQLIGLNDGDAGQALNVTNVDQKELVVDASGYSEAAKVSIPSAFFTTIRERKHKSAD
ncbi:Ig-like domain-containing protein [Paenibacillus sp. RC343]|uniref:Ig-like domain-containing protein n=1 Tax=Paenibacillus sp. RC343 TaxID=3045841 RepID=UPI0024BBD69A|nr:Ig-like domain-containing protein [Paenibacillus sp. RC343]